MKLDREYQKNLLLMLAEDYPRVRTEIAEKIRSLQLKDENKYLANAFYLQEHGLIRNAVGVRRGAQSSSFSVAIPDLTVKGVDFLQQDGGLSAILNVQSVRLDEQTIKALLIAKFERSDRLSAEEKHGLLDSLKESGQKALQHTLEKLIDIALEHPEAITRTIRSACE